MNLRITVTKRTFMPAEVEIEMENVSEANVEALTEGISNSISPLLAVLERPASQTDRA